MKTPKHGDLLPVVGGPLDGSTHAVVELFPALPELHGCLCKGFSWEGHFYKRDGDRFVYVGEEEEVE